VSHRLRNSRVLALLAAIVLALGFVNLGPSGNTAEADLAVPGGISAMPSAAPGIPGVMNQAIPAIIRAKGPGNIALVTVYCDPTGMAPSPGFLAKSCASTDGDVSSPITFELTRIYPPGGPPSSFFHATGTAELTCITAGPSASGGGPCDYTRTHGVVVVEVDGGGVNEIVRVTATDAIGQTRSVDIVVVDTILAWGPTGVLTTAAQHQPAYISYACDTVGRSSLTGLAAEAEATLVCDSLFCAGSDGVAGLDDLWELFHFALFGPNIRPLDNNITNDVDLPLWWCGGDTASLSDDFVDFQTDVGIFSIDPAGVQGMENISDLQAAYGITLPLTLDYDCGEGKDINVADVDALNIWGSTLFDGRAEGGCDADFARNGVVTTSILGNGEVGVATITAQQGGGVSPPRTINLTFVGEAAVSLFIEAPESIGTDGGDFKVVSVDQDGRPVGDETVECTVEPAGGALVVAPQTGTTSSIDSEDPGSLTMKLIPTGASVLESEDLTLTCVLDRDRGISASTKISLSTTPGVEVVQLPLGCFLVGSTWDDGTSVATVAAAVKPAEALDAMWALAGPGATAWAGFSPSALAASDLKSLDLLQAFFICMNEPGTVDRPVI
jgi:hypothetical protein